MSDPSECYMCFDCERLLQPCERLEMLCASCEDRRDGARYRALTAQRAAAIVQMLEAKGD